MMELGIDGIAARLAQHARDQGARGPLAGVVLCQADAEPAAADLSRSQDVISGLEGLGHIAAELLLDLEYEVTLDEAKAALAKG